ncbi:MAG: hypothetical protein H7Z43_15680, partial [Clostridia bacterium]|nr:hypothetical protein [Deltaproteobacteria bacterium]
CPPKSNPDAWKVDELEELIFEMFGIKIDVSGVADVTVERIEETVFGQVERAILAKETEFGADSYYGVARIIYLQTIDQLWKEHLRDMDHLREGISLRGYAQKDPKQEYKKEGYNLFVSMMSAITGDVLQKVSRVVITQETQEEYEDRLQRQRDRQAKLTQSRATVNTPLPGQRDGALATPGPTAHAAPEADGPSVAEKVKRDVSANKKKRERRRSV